MDKQNGPKTYTNRENRIVSEQVIVLDDVWKIFGNRADEAMEAIKSEGLTKPEVLAKFGCVVGVAKCSFEVSRGEIFCVMGLSGSGKSTMVRLLNRLLEPTSGQINVLGKDMNIRYSNCSQGSQRRVEFSS